MDNNFYTTERNRADRRKKEKSSDTVVVLTQLIASLAVTALLFCICKTESGFADELKNLLRDLGKTDIAVSDIFDSFKDVVTETFSPSVSLTDEKDVFSETEQADYNA